MCIVNKKYVKLFVDAYTYEKLKFGLFCINKERFITSAQTVELVKKVITLGIPNTQTQHRIKIGHGGTLDYSASGVLVIGTGHGCKYLQDFLHGDKTYLVQGKLGEATDTYNADGRVVNSSSFDHINEEQLISSLEKFKGEILQVPPPYCALKRNGKRISDLIRSGEKVLIHPRPVTCKSLKCLKFDPPYFTLSVSCSGGFYVRSLVHYLGIALGSFAHVTYLRREKQGPFTLEDSLSFKELNYENVILSVSKVEKKYLEYKKLL